MMTRIWFKWLVAAGFVVSLLGTTLAQEAPQATDQKSENGALPKPIGKGRAWYVAVDGNDKSPGSQQKPWKTLARAGRGLRPGDVVYVQPGHYEGAHIVAVGLKEAPITFISVERHKAIIDQGGFAKTKGTRGHRVQVDGAYTIFDGFAVSTGWDPTKPVDARKEGDLNSPGAGLASYSSRGIVFRNNDCYDNERWGIFTKMVRDIVIENNILRNSRREHGVYHADGATNSILRGNIAYGNGACGIQLNQGRVAPYINILIEGNIMYDNSIVGGQSMNLDGGTDTTIRNNVFIVNRRDGIALYRKDGAEPPRDVIIVNNLFVLENGSRGAILTGDCGKNWIFNNIFWSVAGAPVFDDEELTLVKQVLGYNAANAKIPGENNVLLTGELNDLFENPAERLFRLKPGAAVIDKGTAELEGRKAPELDRAGVKRPQGAGIDLGPFEAESE